jgi:membrane protein DedA with SNARE-associated domain
VILEHATWFLFAWVFSNQAGVPVPVIPALIAAGALAGNGHLSLAVVVALAVGASLTADLTWYALGRWRGPRALKSLGRLAPGAGILIHRVQHAFSAHLGAFQLGARFLPELNAIASGLAGTTRTSIIRFLGYGAASALTWAGGWIGLGYLLSHAVTETAVYLGVRLIVLFLGAFALYLPFRRARRHRLIRVLRQAPVGSDEFSARRWIADRSGTLDDVPATQGSGVSTLTMRGGRS